MTNDRPRFMTYIRTNWERIIFVIVGIFTLVTCFRALFLDNITSGSALFAMAFFSFFYSNLARFKKFKGLGFEAELWEDKQKEAANLIDQLKSIVSVYTREIVMNNVMRGRWSDGENWEQRWALFSNLTGKHAELGQKIDFSPLKREVDRFFVFDICSPLARSLGGAIERAKAEVSKQLHGKYGFPITDVEVCKTDFDNLNSIESQIDDLFSKAETENIAKLILILAQDAKSRLLNDFGIMPQYDQNLIHRLQTMANLVDGGSIVVTPQLIEWSHWREGSY